MKIYREKTHTKTINMKTTNSDKTVFDLLDIPKEEYSMLLIESFHHWAGIYTSDSKELQEFLINSRIQNWFFKEYLKAENEWKNIIKMYSSSTLKTKREFYCSIVSRIYKIYPSAIFNGLKRSKNQKTILNLNKYDTLHKN